MLRRLCFLFISVFIGCFSLRAIGVDYSSIRPQYDADDTKSIFPADIQEILQKKVNLLVLLLNSDFHRLV